MRWIAVLSFAGAVLAQSPGVVVEGNPKSAVRVVAYENLQCSDCAVFRKMLDEQLLPEFGARVAFEHRDFPLEKHKWARKAAVVARYLDGVNLGVAFRRWAYANQRSITAESFDENLAAWAKDNGADPANAAAAAKDPALQKLVEDDYQEGIARGVARTPTVFVNGEAFIETFTVEQISKGIEAALAAVSKN
jgi:protein-disulfide isomerase